MHKRCLWCTLAAFCMGSGLLFVTQAYDPEDPNLGFTSAWIEAFAGTWETVHVVCWRATQPSTKRIRVHVLPQRGIYRAVSLLRLSWQLRRDVSAVFVHMIPTVLTALGWWWRLLGFRIGLWYTHGTVSLGLRLAAWWTHAIFTANASSFRLRSKKVQVVGHGIDLRRFTPDPSVVRSQTILFVGRITPRKDLERFLRITVRVSRKLSHVRAVIAGGPRLSTDETYAAQMRAFVQREGLEGVVVWAGNVLGDALVQLYRSAGVLLSTSRTGSLDKAVLEALACGMPVVAIGREYEGMPGVQVIESDDRLVDTLTGMLRNPQSIDVGAYLANEASLPELAKRVKRGLGS